MSETAVSSRDLELDLLVLSRGDGRIDREEFLRRLAELNQEDGSSR